MCGITGFFSKKANNDNNKKLRQINFEIKHRGPDSHGEKFLEESKIGFAMRRLAIQDISNAGNQPMISKNRKYLMVFNGEIYNFQELRKNLRSYVKGNSDTEVLLEMFSSLGIHNTLLKVNGMFAISLWDLEKKKLFLIRDRLGVKPLYYGIKNNTLWFCSELVDTFTSLFNKKINFNRLQYYLRNSYVEKDTIYKDIKKVKPGTFLVFGQSDLENVEEFCYWSPLENFNQKNSLIQNDLNFKTSKFEKLFEKSIQQRLISDRTLGVFLSNGIDSSLVAYYAQKLSTKNIDTYTLGFNDAKFDESQQASKVANYLNTNHHNIIFAEKNLLDLINKIPKIFNEPFADSSQLPTYLISNYVSDKTKVILTGDGADELFYGYDYYQSIYKIRKIIELCIKNKKINKLIINLLNKHNIKNFLGNQNFEKIIKILLFAFDKNEIIRLKENNEINTFTKSLIKVQSHSDINSNFFEKKLSINQNLCLTDLKNYLEGDILVKLDRSSMSNSIELRSPFVDDFEIVDFALNLNDSDKISFNQNKIFIKKILFSKIPEKFFSKKKRGFSIPLNRWMNNELSENIKDLSTSSYLRNQNIFDFQTVQKLISFSKNGNTWFDQILWSYYIFQIWYKDNF